LEGALQFRRALTAAPSGLTTHKLLFNDNVSDLLRSIADGSDALWRDAARWSIPTASRRCRSIAPRYGSAAPFLTVNEKRAAVGNAPVRADL
jgi:hypothetical protein